MSEQDDLGKGTAEALRFYSVSAIEELKWRQPTFRVERDERKGDGSRVSAIYENARGDSMQLGFMSREPIELVEALLLQWCLRVIPDGRKPQDEGP